MTPPQTGAATTIVPPLSFHLSLLHLFALLHTSLHPTDSGRCFTSMTSLTPLYSVILFQQRVLKLIKPCALYLVLFLQYYSPSPRTPEDLTAIGVKKPHHRKRLTAEIAKLDVPDGLPTQLPQVGPRWWIMDN